VGRSTDVQRGSRVWRTSSSQTLASTKHDFIDLPIHGESLPGVRAKQNPSLSFDQSTIAGCWRISRHPRPVGRTLRGSAAHGNPEFQDFVAVGARQ